MDELLQQISPSTSGRHSDRQRQRGGRRRAEHHRPTRTPSGLALPFSVSFPIAALPRSRSPAGQAVTMAASSSLLRPQRWGRSVGKRQRRGLGLQPLGPGGIRGRWRSGGERSGEGAGRSRRSSHTAARRTRPCRRREVGKRSTKGAPGRQRSRAARRASGGRARERGGNSRERDALGCRGWGGGTAGCVTPPRPAGLDRSCSRRPIRQRIELPQIQTQRARPPSPRPPVPPPPARAAGAGGGTGRRRRLRGGAAARGTSARPEPAPPAATSHRARGQRSRAGQRAAGQRRVG